MGQGGSSPSYAFWGGGGGGYKGDYSSGATYNANDLVRSSTSTPPGIYACLTDGTTGVLPSTGAAASPATWVCLVVGAPGWVYFQDSKSSPVCAAKKYQSNITTPVADT